MTTLIQPGRVMCPKCNGSKIIAKVHTSLILGMRREEYRCEACEDGTIPDPRILEWRESTDPVRLLEMLGNMDRLKLLAWVGACEREYDRINPAWARLSWAERSEAFNAQFAADSWAKDGNVQLEDESGVPAEFRCDLIRCLWPSPFIVRERVECPCLKSHKAFMGERTGCKRCHATGFIEAPIIDPRWLSSTVIDLAKAIRGGCLSPLCKRDKPGWCEFCSQETPLSHFERMPILADALMDAGCDNDDIIGHCQSGTHVAGCFVLKEILK